MKRGQKIENNHKIVIDYNANTNAIGFLGQITTYSLSIRKSIKCLIELLLNTALVINQTEVASTTRSRRLKHELKRKEGQLRMTIE